MAYASVAVRRWARAGRARACRPRAARAVPARWVVDRGCGRQRAERSEVSAATLANSVASPARRCARGACDRARRWRPWREASTSRPSRTGPSARAGAGGSRSPADATRGSRQVGSQHAGSASPVPRPNARRSGLLRAASGGGANEPPGDRHPAAHARRHRAPSPPAPIMAPSCRDSRPPGPRATELVFHETVTRSVDSTIAGRVARGPSRGSRRRGAGWGGNPCTVDSCDALVGVVHAPASSGTSCSDGNVRNGAETCDGAGVCAAGMPLVIDDANRAWPE
jgi:hypothetical protein